MSSLREMDGEKSCSFFQFVEIISSANEMLARGREMSPTWVKKKYAYVLSRIWGYSALSPGSYGFRDLPLTSKCWYLHLFA